MNALYQLTIFSSQTILGALGFGYKIKLLENALYRFSLGCHKKPSSNNPARGKVEFMLLNFHVKFPVY